MSFPIVADEIIVRFSARGDRCASRSDRENEIVALLDERDACLITRPWRTWNRVGCGMFASPLSHASGHGCRQCNRRTRRLPRAIGSIPRQIRVFTTPSAPIVRRCRRTIPDPIG